MAKIKHIFQSSIPDGPDTTLVRPSAWNDDHVIPVDGVLVGDSATNDMTGYAASAANQVLRRNITNTDYEFANLGISVNSSSYNFSRTFSQVISSAGVYAFDFGSLPPGVSSTVYAPTTSVSNVVNNGSGLCRVTFADAQTMETGSCVFISGVVGATQANGAWIVTQVNFTTYDLQGSSFSSAYISGGTAQERPHFMYVSGGAGSNEACPVVSVSGTSVSLLVRTAKSGNYTITSATNGLQEALYAGVPAISVSHGFSTVQGPFTIDGGFFPNVKISGDNSLGSILTRWSGFSVGSVIRIVNGAGPLITGLGIYNVLPVQITSGAAIYYAKGGAYFTTINDVRVINERYGLLAYGTTGIVSSGLDVRQFPNYTSTANCVAGVSFASNPWNSNYGVLMDSLVVISDNPQTAANPMLVGINIEQADGVQISNSAFTAEQGIKIQRTDTSQTVNYVFFNNCLVDNCGTHSLFINSGTTGAGFFQNIRFNGCVFQYTDRSGQLVFIGGDKIRAFGIQFSGCAFSYSYESLVYIGGASNIGFDDCGFTSANASATAGRYYLVIEGPGNCASISVNDCWFDESSGFPDNSSGILLNTNVSKLIFSSNRVNRSLSNGVTVASAFTLSKSVISGNIFANAATLGLLIDGTADRVAISGNTFSDNVSGSMGIVTATNLALGENQYQESSGPTIASASTITLSNNNFSGLTTLSGTTTIQTINGGWPFRQINFITSGVLSFGTSGNIAVAVGPTVAGQLVTGFYNPATSKWHLS